MTPTHGCRYKAFFGNGTELPHDVPDFEADDVGGIQLALLCHYADRGTGWFTVFDYGEENQPFAYPMRIAEVRPNYVSHVPREVGLLWHQKCGAMDLRTLTVVPPRPDLATR